MKYFILLLSIFVLVPSFYGEVRWEVSLGANHWNIQNFKGIIRDIVEDSLEEEIKEQFGEDFPEEILANLDYDFDYDSKGNGYGLNIRMYPRGAEGIFSIGLSYFSFDARLDAKGELIQNFVSSSVFRGTAQGTVNILFRAYLLDLKWEFSPGADLRPYICLGAGFSPLRGDVSYTSEGIFYGPQGEEYYSSSDSEDLSNIDDIDMDYIPILALNAGLKYYFYNNASLWVDIGFFDGLMIKGGLAYSF